MNYMNLVTSIMGMGQTTFGYYTMREARRNAMEIIRKMKGLPEAKIPSEYSEVASRARKDEQTGLSQTEYARGRDMISQEKIQSLGKASRYVLSPSAMISARNIIGKSATERSTDLMIQNQRIKREKRAVTDQALTRKGGMRAVIDDRNRSYIQNILQQELGIEGQGIDAGADLTQAGIGNMFGGAYMSQDDNKDREKLPGTTVNYYGDTVLPNVPYSSPGPGSGGKAMDIVDNSVANIGMGQKEPNPFIESTQINTPQISQQIPVGVLNRAIIDGKLQDTVTASTRLTGKTKPEPDSAETVKNLVSAQTGKSLKDNADLMIDKNDDKYGYDATSIVANRNQPGLKFKDHLEQLQYNRKARGQKPLNADQIEKLYKLWNNKG